MRRHLRNFLRLVFETRTYLERADKARALRGYRAARDKTTDPLWRSFNHKLGHDYSAIVSAPRYPK